MLRRTQYATLWILWLLTCGSACAASSNSRSLWGQYAELVHLVHGARHLLHCPVSWSSFSATPDHTNSQQLSEAAVQPYHPHGTLRKLHHMTPGSEPSREGPLRRHAAAAAAGGGPQTDAAKTSESTTNRDILHRLHVSWPEGYVAVCAVVKDQNKDLRYWLEYHRWLGVNKFYIYDNNSTLPAMLVLWDYIQQGIVDYQYFKGRPRRRPDFRDSNQYKAYNGCLLQHFRQHRWLAFIDIDEFFVFPPANAAGMAATSASQASASKDTLGANARNLLDAISASGTAATDLGSAQPLSSIREQHHVNRHLTGRPHPHGDDSDGAEQQNTGSSGDGTAAAAEDTSVVQSSSSSRSKHNLAVFLSSHEHHAAIGVNWVLFGSSALQERPRGGPLASFTSCVPQEHWESTHVKVIANTGGILGVGPTPHEIIPRAGRSIVDIDGTPFKGPKTQVSKWHKLIIHHYVLKSRAEFAAKNARGSGAGNVKDWSFFDYMDGLSNHTCNWGQPISKAFLASRPDLRPPRGFNSLCGMRTRMQIEAATAATESAAEDLGD